MKLADLATGSDWIVWIVFVIFAVLSIVLLSGHGSWFISGYNTASKEEIDWEFPVIGIPSNLAISPTVYTINLSPNSI